MSIMYSLHHTLKQHNVVLMMGADLSQSELGRRNDTLVLNTDAMQVSDPHFRFVLKPFVQNGYTYFQVQGHIFLFSI